MAEDLQHLIDKIQAEGIDKAQQEAQAITDEARKKATAIVDEAEKKAADLLAKAEQDGLEFAQRGTRTLEQVSRDLLISVGQGLERILNDIVRETLDEAMSINVVQEMLLRVVESYGERNDKERRLAVLVSEEDQKTLAAFCAERLKGKMASFVEIRPDRSLTRGFRISMEGTHAHHDFSQEAIAEAMSKYLRPQLAEIVLRVAKEQQAQS